MKSSEHSNLTSEQKRDACAVLTIGCDRESAAKYIGCTMAEFHRQLEQDAEFSAAVLHAEATCELKHMRNVQTAAGEEKNWRASVWWLERHAPDRYGARASKAPTVGELKTFLSLLVAIIVEEVRDLDDLRRILTRFDEASRSLREMEGAPATANSPLCLPAPHDGSMNDAAAHAATGMDSDGEAI